METLWHDIRFGLRTLRRNPGFAAVAVLTLALGIGANTAIFSVLNAVLLQPLPFGDPDRLVTIATTDIRRPGRTLNTSYPDLMDWRERSRTFDEIAGVALQYYDLTEEGAAEPERIPGEFVTANYFSALGLSPQLGRFLRPEEDRLPEGEPVVVLSHALWARRFSRDPSVVGKSIYLNQRAYAVVGIAPQGFQGYSGGAQLWTPITVVPPALQRYNQIRPARWFAAIGRLAPRVTLAQAQAEMNTITARLGEDYPTSNANFGVSLTPMADQLFGNVRRIVLVLFGAVGLVLLIACANVANLLLARAAAREKEIAIRCALGAGPTRLLRQLITESVLLSVLGGLLGIILARWGVQLLPAFLSGIPPFVVLRLDPAVLAFALGLGVLTGVLFGLAPATRLAGVELQQTLKEGGRSSGGGGRRRRFQNLLVVSELALAVVLLIGAGLLFRTLDQLLSVDLGFNPDRVLTARAVLRDSAYSAGEVETFQRRLLDALEATPGVDAAAVGIHIPLDGFVAGAHLNLEGEALDDPNSGFHVLHHPGSPAYFRVFGIPLLRGRSFNQQDTAEAPGVIILSQSAAERFWPGEDPLGKRVKFRRDDQETRWLSVVGVVGNARFASLTDSDALDVYLPLPQSLFENRFVAVAVRTQGDPAALTSQLRQAIRGIDPTLPIFAVSTLQGIVGNATTQNHTLALLLGGFSVVALGLAALGIYGVMSYSISQRTQEIGVRLALGAQPADILRMVVGQGLALAGLGLGLGLVGALILTRFLANLLYGVSATDPVTFASISILLTTVALLACYLPARRAMRVDPMVALRYE